MADRVVIFLTSEGARQGVASSESVLVGGIKRGAGSATIDGSGNISLAGGNVNLTGSGSITLTGSSVVVNSALDMTSHKINNVTNPTSAQDAATKTYVDTLDAQDIKKNGSVAFTGDESMGGFKLTSVGAPTLTGDATNKTYVDTLDANDIKKDGSITFTADQSMGSHKLTNVTDPASAQDAATKNYVDGLDVNNIKKNGSVAFTADQSMGGHKLTNLGTPAAATDAATKGYVDGASAGIVKKAQTRNVSGNFGSGGLAVVPGGQVSFTLANPGSVVVLLTAATTAFNTLGMTFGYSLDGAGPVAVVDGAWIIGAGSDRMIDFPLNATVVLTGLSAGPHTVDMAFASPNSTLLANASTPAFTVVLYDA